jgi:LuxR family transcriptional regulator, maltose regulon positive regulatory protein
MATSETGDDERLMARSRPRPPVARHHVPRPRVDSALDEAHEGVLGLVCAPAGSGKSEALIGWLSRRDIEAGWLSLDREENDPVVFWPSLAGELDVPAPTTVRCPEQLINRLRAQPATPRTAVLDDYHIVVEPRVHAGLDALLAAGVPSLHLLIASRHDPPLKLSRLRAAGQLREIRMDQLRFDELEATALLNQTLGLDLAEPDVAHLAARTEGWAAALQLAGLALQREPDRHAYIVSFAADDRHVADYMRDEVVATLPDELRHFVEETAILGRLCAELCAAVTDMTDVSAAQATIERLERMNLFLTPLDNRRQWYRYHQLFAEWLRLRPPPWVEERHRRAAIWLADHGHAGEAISHFVQAGEFVAAAELIEARRWYLIGQGREQTLQQWVRVLPAELIQSRANLRLAQAWIAYDDGRWSAVQDLARSVMDLLEAVEDQRGRDAIHAEALFLRAGSLAALGRLEEAGVAATEALTRPPEDHRHTAAASWLVLGKSHLHRGDLAAAAAAFDTARRLDPDIPIITLIASSHAAEIHRRQGHVIEAQEYAEAALATAEEVGLEEHPECAVAHLVLARLHDEAGRHDQAAAHLDRGTELAGRIPYEPRRLMAAAAHQHRRPTSARARTGATVDLTERELEVLRLLASQLSQPEIASTLYVSINTVKTHTRAIYQKLGVSARHSAIEQARLRNLL